MAPVKLDLNAAAADAVEPLATAARNVVGGGRAKFVGAMSVKEAVTATYDVDGVQVAVTVVAVRALKRTQFSPWTPTGDYEFTNGDGWDWRTRQFTAKRLKCGTFNWRRIAITMADEAVSRAKYAAHTTLVAKLPSVPDVGVAATANADRPVELKAELSETEAVAVLQLLAAHRAESEAAR